MRRIKVCIYGGTDLQGAPPDFIADLAYEILNSMPAVIVTGGFLHSNSKPEAISTDRAALNGARRYANDRGVPLTECFEAWVPEPTLDSRPDVQGAVRMSANDGVTIRVMEGRTPLGRRLAMVDGVDMVVTISGSRHTEVVVEQALERRVPVLPIPDADGDSKDLLKKYRARIAADFEPGALATCLETVSRTIATQPKVAARAVVALIGTAKLGRCLALFPYDDEHEKLYASSIEPVVARHMIPVRLDHVATSQAIYSSFAEAVRSATALIADITVLNENVMYEVGYAHGRGLVPLLYTRDASRLNQLPVYFRTLNVRPVSETMPIDILVNDYLHAVKTTR